MQTWWKKGPSFRSMALMATSAVALCYPAAAWSQNSDEAVLGILRECAKIDDPIARLNCYDSNVRSDRSSGRAPAISNESAGGSGNSFPATGGFGAESVRNTDRFKSYSQTGQGSDEIRARILEVRQREPGVFLVTIEDGAQWLFAQSVSKNFRPPRKGALVEIKRASLGSFLMVVDGQAAVRVRRLK